MNQLLEKPRRGGTVLVLSLCCLAAASEGVDLQAPGLTVPVLAQFFHMSAGTKGLFLGIGPY